jgi:hypothetical protein
LSVFKNKAAEGHLLYYPFDTHWNVEGRRTAAAFIASHLHGRKTGSRSRFARSRKLPAASDRARDGEFKLYQIDLPATASSDAEPVVTVSKP